MNLPRVILFDLDDTILVAFGPTQSQWQRTIAGFADQLGPIEATAMAGDRGGLDRIMGRSGASQILAPPHRRRAQSHRRDHLCRARGGRPSGAE